MGTINAGAPYAGEVEYATVTPSGGSADEPGSAVTGVNCTIDPQVRTVDGIGMQRVSHRSHYQGVIGYDVTFPTKALLSAMLRASATNSVAAATCVAGNQDSEWSLASSQPSGFTARCAIGEPLGANLGYWGIPSQGTTGGTMGAPSSSVVVGDTGFGVAVEGTDYLVQSWEVTLNTNPYWFVAQNHTTSDSAPDAVKLGVQDVTLRLSCAKQIPDATALFTPDEHEADFDVTIIGVNSADAEQIKFTFSDLGTPVEAGNSNVGGLRVWDYDFPACKQLGVLAIT